MLGSNQRPLPCECGSSCSYLFANVQKPLRISKLDRRCTQTNFPVFTCIGVLLVYQQVCSRGRETSVSQAANDAAVRSDTKGGPSACIKSKGHCILWMPIKTAGSLALERCPGKVGINGYVRRQRLCGQHLTGACCEITAVILHTFQGGPASTQLVDIAKADIS